MFIPGRMTFKALKEFLVCKSLSHGFKAVACGACGAKFVSRYSEPEGFVLEDRTARAEAVLCPECDGSFDVELDTLPASAIKASCPNCSASVRVARSPDGSLTLKATRRQPAARQSKVEPTDEVVEQVRDRLPAQPWPKGIHRDVAKDLGLPPALVSKCINILIHKHVFNPQMEGIVYLPESQLSVDACRFDEASNVAEEEGQSAQLPHDGP